MAVQERGRWRKRERKRGRKKVRRERKREKRKNKGKERDIQTGETDRQSNCLKGREGRILVS